MASCASCHAPIFWAVTASTGKRMPVDITPTTTGNLVIRDGKIHHVTTIPEAERPDKLYTSHFATCPDGRRWRKGSAW